MSFRAITLARENTPERCWQATPLGDCASRAEALAAGERWIATLRSEAGDGAVLVLDLDKPAGGEDWLGTGWLPVGIDELLFSAAARARGQVGGEIEAHTLKRELQHIRDRLHVEANEHTERAIAANRAAVEAKEHTERAIAANRAAAAIDASLAAEGGKDRAEGRRGAAGWVEEEP
jgi:hypothetical protein